MASDDQKLDSDIFRSLYTFKHNFDTDYSIQFNTEYGARRNANQTAEDEKKGNEKGDGEKDGEGADLIEEIPDWSQFTENTTFHGIKYIFHGGLRFRRFLWVACVLSAICVFFFQVGSRTWVFFEYNTNVDVEVVYTNKVPFPAVTICNQNNYRTTVTVENQLYYFIDTIFSAENKSLVDLSPFPLDGVHTMEFIQTTGHQLTDFIDSCTWKGEACNLTRDFVSVMTDMGLCYTFNHGKHSDEGPLTVMESGSVFALSLILNVEQYEYMKGPQNDAGAKILLHDQDEFPLMQDLGFAVAPGTHTLVGVQQTIIDTMSAPYGECDIASNKSMSDCLLECRTREIVKRCDCRDVYMKNLTLMPSEVCSMEASFVCVREELAKLQKEEKRCVCLVPCHRVKFEPSLSYAQLSQFNMDRIVLKDPGQRQRVGQNFLLAREYTQRVNLEQAQKDKDQLNEILTLVEKLTTSINDFSTRLLNRDKFTEVYQVPQIITPGFATFKDDHRHIVKRRTEFFKNMTLEMDYWYSFWYSIGATELFMGKVFDELMDEEQQNRTLFTALEECASNFTEPFNVSRDVLGRYQDAAPEDEPSSSPVSYGYRYAYYYGYYGWGKRRKRDAEGTEGDEMEDDYGEFEDNDFESEDTEGGDRESKDTKPMSESNAVSGMSLEKAKFESRPKLNKKSASAQAELPSELSDAKQLSPLDSFPQRKPADTIPGSESLTDPTEDYRDLSPADQAKVRSKRSHYSYYDDYGGPSYDCSPFGGPNMTRSQYSEEVLVTCAHMMEDCDDYIATKLKVAQSLAAEDNQVASALADISSTLAKLDSYLVNVYADTNQDFTELDVHQYCLNYTRQVSTSFYPVVNNVSTVLNELGQTTTLAEFAPLATAVTELSDDPAFRAFVTSGVDVNAVCRWPDAYSSWMDSGKCADTPWDPDIDCPKFLIYVDSLNEAERKYQMFQIAFASLQNYIETMHYQWNQYVIPLMVARMYEYLDHNITKSTLAHTMDSLVLKKALSTLLTSGRDFSSAGREFLREAEAIQSDLLNAYDALFTQFLPAVTNTMLDNMVFIRAVRETNITEYLDILEGLHAEPAQTYNVLLKDIFNKYVAIISEMRLVLNDDLDRLQDLLSELEDDLSEYRESSRMNEKFYAENFLQVDIFYKELSYEKISQHAAFEFLSLLSEVGGFLGLLLGASVLTVCEMLDFLSMQFIKHWNSKSRVFQGPSPILNKPRGF